MGTSHSSPALTPITQIDYKKIERTTNNIINENTENIKTHIEDSMKMVHQGLTKSVKNLIQTELQNNIFVKISEIVSLEVKSILEDEIKLIVEDIIKQYTLDIFNKLESIETTISNNRTSEIIDISHLKTDINESIDVITIKTKDIVINNNTELIEAITDNVKDYINKKMMKNREETKELINEHVILTKNR